MKKSIFYFFICFIMHSNVYSFSTSAEQAIIYDVETKTVIFEKNADDLMSPSSMSKLMTVYYIFKKISDGEIKLSDKFTVSKKAWKKGGSRMFLNVGSQISIDELLRGIIIQSGNDACITIAEGFSGSEENFAYELNSLALDIGLTNSNFTNATGWPDPEHLMTSRDIMKLSLRTIEDFPELYKIYSEKEYTFNKIRQVNRNPLLFSDEYTDGLKTGHTSLGGYGLAASSIRNDRRIILVINGLKNNKQRKIESKKLMDTAFFQFENLQILEKNIIFDKIKVWNGKKNNVGIFSPKNLAITIPRLTKKNTKTYIRYNSPIIAPIYKNQEIAELIVKDKKQNVIEKFPLLSNEDINESNFFVRVYFKLKYLIFGESIYKLDS